MSIWLAVDGWYFAHTKGAALVVRQFERARSRAPKCARQDSNLRPTD